MITFDDGFIKEIPNSWNIDRIKDVMSDYHGGSTPRSDSQNWEDGEIIWVTPTDFQKQKDVLLFDSERKITEIGLRSCSTKIVPQNAVIMCSRASIGDVRIAGTELCTNQGFINFITSTAIFFKFYFYIIKGHLGDYYNEIAPGTTYKEISGTKAAIENIPLPPLPEQKLISAYLDKTTAIIDKAISVKKEQLNKLEELKKSIIYKAVTKGLDDSAEMKDSGIKWIGEIPENWEVLSLKRLLNSPLKYGANESAELEGEDFPRYIRITDFGSDGKLREDTFKSLTFEQAEGYMLKEGDVLFARSGATVGKTFMFKNYKGKACFAGYLIKANTLRYKLDPDFLYLYTKSPAYESWKNLIFTQATIQNIGADKYAYLPITLPPISEQKIIIAYLEKKTTEIDSASERITLQIEKLENYKKSLIHECVTGKRRIAGNDIPEAV